MLTNQTMAASGRLLFRWRSYVLLVFLPLVVMTLPEAEHVEDTVGEFFGEIFEITCLLAAVAGLALRAYTVGFAPAGTSGRNTTRQVATVLNTTGIYSVTRNPLYLGNCITYMGIILSTQNLMLGFAFGLFLVLYYERIIVAEETFLVAKFGETFTSWAAEVPAFCPRFRGWQSPALSFSYRTVLRREYSGWLAAVLVLFFIEIGHDIAQGEGWPIDTAWLTALGLAAVVYLVLLLLKKRTTVLNVDGR